MNRPNHFATAFLVAALTLTACTTAVSEETSATNSGESATTSTVGTQAETTPPTTMSATLPAEPSATNGVEATRDVPFTDGLLLDVFAPASDDPLPVVVFFHGGSWYGGAKENVEPFARALAEDGYVVFNATYRTGQQGGGYPQSYEDIGCAISVTNALATEYGGDPDRIFVAGHSAGAQLGSTVLFAGDAFAGGSCSEEGNIAAAGFIGISGPYDVTGFAPLLSAWFGGTIADIPDVFTAGGPFAYLDRPPIPVLLIHGTADELVPTDLTDGLADALGAAGWNVEIALIDAASHGAVIDPLGAADDSIAAMDSFTGN